MWRCIWSACRTRRALTIIWLSMRAVLDVGGYCAEGGPYVIAQHCPDGVAWLLPLSIFAGLGSAGLMGWKGAQLGGPYGGLVLLAWPALFISLGWNFLEFAFFPPEGMTGIELGLADTRHHLRDHGRRARSWASCRVARAGQPGRPAVPMPPTTSSAEARPAISIRCDEEHAQLVTDLVHAAEQQRCGPDAATSRRACPPATEERGLVCRAGAADARCIARVR